MAENPDFIQVLCSIQAGSPLGSRRSPTAKASFCTTPFPGCTKPAVFLSDSQASARNLFDNWDVTCDKNKTFAAPEMLLLSVININYPVPVFICRIQSSEPDYWS